MARKSNPRKTAPESREYRVRWEIDVEATSPEQAAREAVKIMKRPYKGSIAHVFDVYGKLAAGTVYARVDLDVLDGKNVD